MLKIPQLICTGKGKKCCYRGQVVDRKWTEQVIRVVAATTGEYGGSGGAHRSD
ncbi:hypothetical protein Hdeb2414_s0006g00194921 [Helianthus debilis subsp. tardiflorus]